MASGDVTTDVVQNPTEASVDTALTALVSTVEVSGSFGAFAMDGKVWLWGIAA